jgi:uncharacterized damage-inducible protein DinB
MTHEESLLQLPFRGNCFNWVVGHLVVSRDRVLEILGEQPLLTPEEKALYANGSDPITEATAAQAVRFEKLLADLDTSQQRIAAALQRLTYADMEALSNERPLGKRLAYFAFHDSYHTGQTEILRQLAGKDDKVIA